MKLLFCKKNTVFIFQPEDTGFINKCYAFLFRTNKFKLGVIGNYHV